jgi:hypothetical protein
LNVINNQDARLLSFILEPPIEHGQEESTPVPHGRKSASTALFIPSSITFFGGRLSRQPGDEPGAEKSDHYSY